MSPVTHFFTGWVIANAGAAGKRSRLLVTLAAVSPNVDGLGIIPGWFTRNSGHRLLWFSLYHHTLHTLAFAVTVAVLSFFLAGRWSKVAALSFFSFHVHLGEDLLGSRGPDGYPWPLPTSSRSLVRGSSPGMVSRH